jgi:hypothetical protein
MYVSNYKLMSHKKEIILINKCKKKNIVMYNKKEDLKIFETKKKERRCKMS